MLTKNRIHHLKRYCREPLENIKGYRESVEADGRYDCHHINELTFTKDELIKMNMYYHRPASELVFMKAEDHSKWHCKWNGNSMEGMSAEKAPNWKGEDAGPKGKYCRAKKLYIDGKMSEEEFQMYRDIRAEYERERRKHK